jgi:hypothetical protein
LEVEKRFRTFSKPLRDLRKSPEIPKDSSVEKREKR